MQSPSLRVLERLNLVLVEGLEVATTQLRDRLQWAARPGEQAESARVIERGCKLDLAHCFLQLLLRSGAPVHFDCAVDDARCAADIYLTLVHFGVAALPQPKTSLQA